MKRMIVFTARGGARMAIAAFDVHRVYQCDDPNICEVIYQAYDNTEWVERTIHVHGTLDAVLAQIEQAA